MLLAAAGDVYPACTRLRLASRGPDDYRRGKADQVWQAVIARLAVGVDTEALLYALADGVPWR